MQQTYVIISVHKLNRVKGNMFSSVKWCVLTVQMLKVFKTMKADLRRFGHMSSKCLVSISCNFVIDKAFRSF